MIVLDSILESDAFRSYDSGKTYPESGSFVAFMIDNYDLDKMLSIFRTGSRMDSKEVIKQNFQSIYGFSVVEAEELRQKFLDNF
ncbi:MAG: hypothetical protein GTN73_05095 [Candidatus Aminicenantes bacterium]|nr:hypothetical protein [Candidatus Aminicenantes bacterium]